MSSAIRTYKHAVQMAVLSGACLLLGRTAHAQTQVRGDTFDTAYVKDYSHILTGRLYSSTKYNKMQLGGLKGTKALIFRPNSKYNFGVGAGYHALTLNIGVGIPGLNKDQDIRGETRYFDAPGERLYEALGLQRVPSALPRILHRFIHVAGIGVGAK